MSPHTFGPFRLRVHNTKTISTLTEAQVHFVPKKSTFSLDEPDMDMEY